MGRPSPSEWAAGRQHLACCTRSGVACDGLVNCFADFQMTGCGGKTVVELPVTLSSHLPPSDDSATALVNLLALKGDYHALCAVHGCPCCAIGSARASPMLLKRCASFASPRQRDASPVSEQRRMIFVASPLPFCSSFVFRSCCCSITVSNHRPSLPDNLRSPSLGGPQLTRTAHHT